eukprot:14795973-Alexandrium_andersonii.AAC.1
MDGARAPASFDPIEDSGGRAAPDFGAPAPGSTPGPDSPVETILDSLHEAPESPEAAAVLHERFEYDIDEDGHCCDPSPRSASEPDSP